MKMKVSNSKSLLLSLLLIAAVSFSISAQDARKEFTESFNISKGATLDTDTKYSDVELVTWEKDVVDVLAVVEVKADSKNRAEERLKKINIDIAKSGNRVSVETDFDDGWSKQAKVKINITIKAPAYVNLDMASSYGDIFIQENTGHVMMDMKYGNLKAGKFTRGNEKPVNLLELAYSNATIDEAGWLQLELAYSDIELNTSDMLMVESKYSKILGGKAGGITAEDGYGKFVFDEIDSFEGELRYSGIKTGTLHKKLNVESRYTHIKVMKLSKGFKEVNASLSYGNLYLGVEQGASFKLDGASKYGKISVDKEGKLSKSKEGTTMKVWGTVGSSPKSTISVITRYGSIEIE
jgi:hypothetical protein